MIIPAQDPEYHRMAVYSRDETHRATIPAPLTVHHQASCMDTNATLHVEMPLHVEAGLFLNGVHLEERLEKTKFFYPYPRESWFAIKSGYSGRCLGNAPGQTVSNGQNVGFVTCDNTDVNQLFFWEGLMLKHGGTSSTDSLCIAAKNADSSDGAELIFATCINTELNHRWQWHMGNQLVNAATSRCMGHEASLSGGWVRNYYCSYPYQETAHRQAFEYFPNPP
eukprot:4903918-Prymnesium_polylepis.2